MHVSSRSTLRERPENLVRRLVARLSHHALWDSLLLFVPPAVALIYVLSLFFQAAWLSQNAAVVTAFFIVALGALAVSFWRRPHALTVDAAARLADQRSGAKDHFLTLATVDAAKQPEAFVARLRRQTEWFLDRVDLKRDFPYRFKRSSYWSLSGSLIAVIFIHLFLLFGQPGDNAAAVPERLRELARQMAVRPNLRTLAKEIEAIAARLDDPKLSAREKQALAQQLERKIEEQQKKAEQKDNQDLLAQAASALGGQQQQQAASGQQQKEQQKGGGGIQTNAPQDSQGENKQDQSGSGEGKGESNSQLSQGMDPGKSSQTDPKERGQEKNRSGEAKDNQSQPDPNQPGDDRNKEKPGKTQGGSKEGAGKQQASAEPPPPGGSPAERFYKAGEGKEGLKGAGYVTVQLPEEVVADAKGESRATKDPKNSRTRTQVPVSNVPLPAHVPNAPAEKQPLPIEYRGIIR
jgi:hypothetical protein